MDYFWLSSHIYNGDFKDGAFDTVLACKSVGVLQTFNAGLDDPLYKSISDLVVRGGSNEPHAIR